VGGAVDTPIRDDIHPDVKWLSCDKDGRWFVWEKKPYPVESRDEWMQKGITTVQLVFRGEPNPNWRDSLVFLGTTDSDVPTP
jgi:hypothetical protein